MLAKNMLVKTRDELLPQNKKSQNEKTIMVRTWHSALKHLSKIFQENKMKSIRNYIVRTDIKEANDQKKPKITTSCYSCRKTCHQISSDETLKNIYNGKEIKMLDGGNCRTANVVYVARCRIHGDIYIGNTGEELRERFSKHRYDAKNRPDNNELAAHIHKHQEEFDKNIEVLILKGNLHEKHKGELWEDKFICLLGTKASTGLNIELKHYGRQLYEAFADFTA